ncbi:MAG: hypothetical protein KQJ78_16805 [Deltaproteobacteria bacterium]|nr:hypothetical protein [Deltaproteobacteria bacterium]
MELPTNAMTFGVLIKAEGDGFVAHCMELDIVAEAPTLEEVNEEIESLIATAVEYAFSNNNLEHLYRPAPPEVWEEFYRCVEAGSKQIPVMRSFAPEGAAPVFIPPWIITKNCRAIDDCSA